MKNAWHTKTLFIQWGKYKWACKYDHCVECKTCTSKHKWRWLCTKCWDRNRDNDPKRKEIKYKAWHKWHTINKPRKPREEWKPMWQKPFLSLEDKKKYMHEWYIKWRDAILTIKKWVIRKKKWLPYVEYMGYPLPFETLSKPFDINQTCSDEVVDKWRSDMILFDKVREYLNK